MKARFEPLSDLRTGRSIGQEGREAGFRCSRETTDQFPRSGHSADDFEAVADLGSSVADS
jgi:hypothetical protein